ncbi:MAG: hypothetical protein N3G74_02045 [Candidatus Micrarchaeota archaeon]|nr:hypothetical protein [Candidatus Micrarchaeota archaeon]
MEREKLMIIGIIVLFVLNVYQYLNYNSLKQLHINYVEKTDADIAKLNSEKQELNRELQQLFAKYENKTAENKILEQKYLSLEWNYTKLNESYNLMIENYTLLSKEYQNLKEEATTLLISLDKYAARINESMSWFSKNSNIDNIDSSLKTSLEDDLKTECYKINFDECTIKTACLLLVNDEFYGLKYISDTSLYGKTDKLSSLNEFLSNRGGDCEDYSLFYKAEINHILDKCRGKKIIIESYIPIDNGKRYFINKRDTWYIRDAEAKPLKDGNIYPYVVCYLTEPYLGHCVVAFSKHKINESSQINLLEGAELVEPQDGSYLGEIGRTVRLPIKPDQLNELMIVISDNDLYSYDEDGWTGYQDFFSKIKAMKTELQTYLK